MTFPKTYVQWRYTWKGCSWSNQNLKCSDLEKEMIEWYPLACLSFSQSKSPSLDNSETGESLEGTQEKNVHLSGHTWRQVVGDDPGAEQFVDIVLGDAGVHHGNRIRGSVPISGRANLGVKIDWFKGTFQKNPNFNWNWTSKTWFSNFQPRGLLFSQSNQILNITISKTQSFFNNLKKITYEIFLKVWRNNQ